jgi:TRAP-type mannitol/chloroaromatic compound transport system permease small subunit
MKAMAATIRAIEALNEWTGRAVSWLVVLLVFNTFLVAVLRYGFSRGWVWLQESYVWMHAIIFLVAAGYTLLHENHVRIDIFYGPATKRTKAWVNALGTALLLWPTLVAIGWVTWPYVRLSWSRLESSQEAGGLPGLFLLKSCMLAFVVLVGLQGLALFLRSVMVLLGHAEWDPHGSRARVEH